jgi:hypothetical protein
MKVMQLLIECDLVTALQAEGTYQRACNGHPVCTATDTSCNAFYNGSSRACCCFGRPYLIDLFSFSLGMPWHRFTRFLSPFKRGLLVLQWFPCMILHSSCNALSRSAFCNIPQILYPYIIRSLIICYRFT